jgi:hypothetical protein
LEVTRDEIIEKARAFLFRRQAAYRQTFAGPVPAKVLTDLARFCRADSSTFSPDPHVAARLDGRREVWLRIAQHLNLTQEQMWQLYGSDDSQ